LSREIDTSQRLLKKAQEAKELADAENQQETRTAYIALAENKLLLSLYGREQSPGWVMPLFPIFDAAREDKACAK
jgi:hypothetical protein